MTASAPFPAQAAVDFGRDAWALVVDDHPMFCDALDLTLRSICAFSVIRSANSIAEASDLIDQNTPPSLVVLDLNLPDSHGFEGLTRILSLIAPSPLVVVSSASENKIVASALDLGASGFVAKHAPRSTFQAAIETIQAGGVYRPDSFIATEMTDEQSNAFHAVATLTAQQARILELISAGLLNKQIAHELSIAEATVKAHVTAIMRKLGVNNRTQAVLVAQEAKFEKMLPTDKASH